MKKRIAIIIQMLSGGGAERTAANLSIDLSNEYDVHLIVFDGSNATYKHSGTVHDLKLPAHAGKMAKIITFMKRLLAVRRIKGEVGVSCSISLMEGANLVNILSKKDEKVIISERNLISFFIKGGVHKKLEQYVLKKADWVVSLSEVVRNDLIRNFNASKEKVITIYNSVDTSKFQFSENEVTRIENYQPYIVTMGRLTEQKAQWHIIRAFSNIARTHPEYKLLILGKGEMEEQYNRFISSLGLEDRIFLLGFQPNPHQIISNADLFAFSSMVEGLGSVLLEAIACGKAVVSTDCDAGPREILAPNTDINLKTKNIEYSEYGILVPITENDKFDETIISLTAEEECLASAMERLISDKELRISYEKKAKARSLDFTPSSITKKWMEIIG